MELHSFQRWNGNDTSLHFPLPAPPKQDGFRAGDVLGLLKGRLAFLSGELSIRSLDCVDPMWMEAYCRETNMHFFFDL